MSISSPFQILQAQNSDGGKRWFKILGGGIPAAFFYSFAV